MNELKTFGESVAKEVEKLLGEGYSASCEEVVKNNNTPYVGIIVRSEASSMAPILYLSEEDLTENVTDAAESIVTQAKNRFNAHLSFDFTDYEQVKNHLAFKIVSSENLRNLATNGVHCSVFAGGDLCYYIQAEDIRGDAVHALKVDDELMELWGVDHYQICIDTLANFKKEQTMIQSFMGSFDILTNETMLHGARRIFDRKALHDHVKSKKAYLCPSSVHEWLIMTHGLAEDAEIIQGIIKDVNQNVIAPEEKLSDNLYMYDPEKDEFYKYSKSGTWRWTDFPDFFKEVKHEY